MIVTNDLNNAALAAADALSQLEHGVDSKAFVVSQNLNVLKKVKSEALKQKKKLKNKDTKMVKHKEPCPDCQGNGYRRIWKDTSEVEKITIQCSTCDSEGELEVLLSRIIKREWSYMTIDNFKNYKEKEAFEKELLEKVEFWKDEIRIHGGTVPVDNDALNADNSKHFVNYKDKVSKDSEYQGGKAYRVMLEMFRKNKKEEDGKK